MEIYDKPIYLDSSVIGLGFFDGVHLGHRELIKKVVEYAKYYNTKSVIVTLKKSPAECFKQNVKYLTTREERAKIIEELGINILIEFDFDNELMNMSHFDYLEKILVKNFNPKAIVTGFNHTFGKDKKGTPMFLKENQQKFNYEYIEIPAQRIEGDVISSTLVKNKLMTGAIKQANIYLNRNFKISGKVIEGNHIGRTIGFPTANIDYPFKMAEIPFGVYSTIVNVRNRIYKGILNYGLKPSVNENAKKPIAEVHIIDFNDNIYGEEIEVSLIDRIRDEQKFDSLDELKLQILKDIQKC